MWKTLHNAKCSKGSSSISERKQCLGYFLNQVTTTTVIKLFCPYLFIHARTGAARWIEAAFVQRVEPLWAKKTTKYPKSRTNMRGIFGYYVFQRSSPFPTFTVMEQRSFILVWSKYKFSRGIHSSKNRFASIGLFLFRIRCCWHSGSISRQTERS